MEKYEYKGYRYEPEEEIDPGENYKIHHLVYIPCGETVILDWSPYSIPTEQEFRDWINLGMPDRLNLKSRHASSPLNSLDLKIIKFIKWSEMGHFTNRDFHKLNDEGLNYLITLLENCPCDHEWNFNKWIFGKGQKFRTDNKKQNVNVECLYATYLNAHFKGKK